MGFFSAIANLFRGPSHSSRTVIESGRSIRAKYDAAGDTNETRNIWSQSDALDADSANSLGVRRKLRERSRYARASDADCSGIVRTHAHYVVGLGPRLRLKTGSDAFNRMVESAWNRWCRKVGFARKLRTMAKAKTGDGEGIAVVFQNSAIVDSLQKVALDFRPLECDRLTDPNGTQSKIGYIDGIELDSEGNPAFYDILERHPGASFYGYVTGQQYSRRWPAKFVLHWFSEDRPEQHRGVPELTSSLNLFATSRRYREAVVAAAETAADFSVILKVPATNEGPDEVRPFTTMPIEKRMMIATPAGSDAVQMRAEQPTTGYADFIRAQTREKARPIGMSYNIAAADSSGYSFSGGKLDHETYFVGIDVERDDCELLVCDRVFALWFEEATQVYGWTGDGTSPAHIWSWPARPQIDQEKTANANKVELESGQRRLGSVYEEYGWDFEEEIVLMAQEYGVSVDEIRRRLLEINLSGNKQPQPAKSNTQTDGNPPAKANGKANGHNRITELLGTES